MIQNQNNKYLLFIDESGKSRLSDEGEEFLLCGFIIEKEFHDAMNKVMINFKQKYNIPINRNLHAFELFEKEKINNVNLKHKDITDFFNNLISLIKISYRIIIFKIEKEQLKKLLAKSFKKLKKREKDIFNQMKKNNDDEVLYEILSAKLIQEFSKTLLSKNMTGSVIAETRAYNDEALIKGFKLSRDKNLYTENSSLYKNAINCFEYISSLTFENKKAISYGLEVSDIFAWAKLNEKSIIRKDEYSKAKNVRIKNKIDILNNLIKNNKQNKVEDVKINMKNELINYRVSKIINNLKY